MLGGGIYNLLLRLLSCVLLRLDECESSLLEDRSTEGLAFCNGCVII